MNARRSRQASRAGNIDQRTALAIIDELDAINEALHVVPVIRRLQEPSTGITPGEGIHSDRVDEAIVELVRSRLSALAGALRPAPRRRSAREGGR